MRHLVKQLTIRIADELAESADIMAYIRRQTLSAYIADAVAARIADDIEDNAKAYQEVLAARERQKQQRGA